MSPRASVMRPIVAQMVTRPLASQSAIAACGSSETCSTICVEKRCSKIWSDCGEARLDVAFADRLRRVDVAVRRMHQVGVVLHRLERIEDGRQRLIFDDDLARSPHWRSARSSQRPPRRRRRHGRPARRRAPAGPGRTGRSELTGMSLPVSTAITPGIFSAALVSMRLMLRRGDAGPLDAGEEHAREAPCRRYIWSGRARAGGRPGAWRVGRWRGSAGGLPAPAARADRARAAAAPAGGGLPPASAASRRNRSRSRSRTLSSSVMTQSPRSYVRSSCGVRDA